MRDEKKSKAQLIEELNTLRQRVIRLGTAETERRHAEEALLEAEDTLYRLKKAVETTGVGITISDRTGKIIYSNPADARIHGYEPEELIGQPSNIFATPEQRIGEELRIEDDELFQDWERERINMRKDGSLFPAKLTSNPIYDTQKFHIGSVTVCEDISERKKTEKALRQSLQLLEKTFAGLEEAVLVIDSSDRSIVLCNPSIEHIFGYSEEEMFGKHINALFSDQTVYTRFEKDLFHALDAKEVFYAECRMRRKDGNIFISEHTATEITDDSGVRTSVLMVVRDISERKQAEAELKKYHEHLEELVEERTADLTKAVAETQHLNEQLEQEIAFRKHAEERIKSSLQDKEVLLKEVHHRVKNNMQVISSLLNLQSTHLHDTHSQQILQESQDRIRSMALIHEKLYQSETLTKIDFHDYVRTLAHDLYISYGPRAANIQLALQIDNISVGIDIAIPCGLIINELISNSLKHAFPENTGGIRIVMEAREGGAYALTISDDGVGLSKDFNIGANGTLGLQLVKGLAGEQLKGSLTLQNTPGTTWRIEFQIPA